MIANVYFLYTFVLFLNENIIDSFKRFYLDAIIKNSKLKMTHEDYVVNREHE